MNESGPVAATFFCRLLTSTPILGCAHRRVLQYLRELSCVHPPVKRPLLSPRTDLAKGSQQPGLAAFNT